MASFLYDAETISLTHFPFLALLFSSAPFRSACNGFGVEQINSSDTVPPKPMASAVKHEQLKELLDRRRAKKELDEPLSNDASRADSVQQVEREAKEARAAAERLKSEIVGKREAAAFLAGPLFVVAKFRACSSPPAQASSLCVWLLLAFSFA